MKYALNLAEDGRILSATYEKYAPADAVLVDELPDGDISDYLYKDGQYVYDPMPEPEPVEERTVWDELDAAWDAGFNEGYQEGVNTAYDQ